MWFRKEKKWICFNQNNLIYTCVAMCTYASNTDTVFHIGWYQLLTLAVHVSPYGGALNACVFAKEVQPSLKLYLTPNRYWSAIDASSYKNVFMWQKVCMAVKSELCREIKHKIFWPMFMMLQTWSIQTEALLCFSISETQRRWQDTNSERWAIIILWQVDSNMSIHVSTVHHKLEMF